MKGQGVLHVLPFLVNMINRLLLITMLALVGLDAVAQNKSNPGGVIKKCDAGPKIVKIYDITPEQAKVQFYGINVYGLDASVFDSQGKKLMVSRIVPTSPEITVPLNNLKPGKYRLVLSGTTCTGSSEMAFSVLAGASARALAKCEAGPDIMEIYSVNSERARVQFSGINVFGITASVFDSQGKLAVSSSIVPASSDILVPLNNLKPGKYKLRLAGNTCKGASEKFFTIPASNAGLRTSGQGQVKYMARGYAKHLDLVITGTSENWILNDEATDKPAAGYEFRYLVNGVLLTQSTPLKNYRYQSNNPLRVLKMQTKPGLESLSKWSDRERSYFYDPQAGHIFNEGNTAALSTVVFNVDSPAGGFINPIPKIYNPETQLTAWADAAPDMKLPKGHFWVAKKGEWSTETVLKKGVTHLSKYEIQHESVPKIEKLKNAGMTYDEVPRPEAFMNLAVKGEDRWVSGHNRKYWPTGPLTEKEAIQKAEQADAGHALWIGETMEGSSYMAPGEPMWGHFYKRFRQRYEANFGARGIPYFIGHNYFMFWPDAFKLGDGNSASERAKKKSLFKIPVSQFPRTDYSPGGTLSSTNLITEAIYLNAPDNLNGALFGSLYRMELYKRMGYKAGIFLFAVHEWKPNNAYQYWYKDGQYYFHDKLPLDPNLLIAYAFLSQIYGNLYVEWGGTGKQSTKNWDDPKGAWHPDGSRIAQPGFPHVAKANEPGYHGYNGGSDLSYFGIKLYNDTFGAVDGGVRQYLKFRIDGKAWIVPDSIAGNNIVDAHYDRRGIVLSQSKNGKTAWFYINPYADNLAHKLEVIMPDGTVVTERVAGNGVHVKVR